MRVVLWTGSRGWRDVDTVIDCVTSIKQPFMSIMGDAEGWDALVWEVLAEFQLPRLCFDAKWKLYGQSAGPVRNLLMLNWLQRLSPDGFVFAGWDGHSPGTKNCMKIAKELGIPIWRATYIPSLNKRG